MNYDSNGCIRMDNMSLFNLTTSYLISPSSKDKSQIAFIFKLIIKVGDTF